MQLETPRLLIRPFTVADVGDYWKIVRDPDVMRYLGGPLTRDGAAAYIERSIASQKSLGYSRYAVIQRASGTLVGMCGYALVRDYIDLGYRFARPHWRQGFATEAASAVLGYGFRELGFAEVIGLALTANTGSIAVLKKLGFTHQQDEISASGESASRYALRNPAEAAAPPPADGPT